MPLSRHIFLEGNSLNPGCVQTPHFPGAGLADSVK